MKNKIKRGLSLLFALFLIAGLLPAAVVPQAEASNAPASVSLWTTIPQEVYNYATSGTQKGTVETFYYNSSCRNPNGYTDSLPATVYLPYGYYTSNRKAYDVLFIYGGSMDSGSEFISKTVSEYVSPIRGQDIFDYLIANGYAEPVIVVGLDMSTWSAGYSWNYNNAANTDIQTVYDYVVSHYRTWASLPAEQQASCDCTDLTIAAHFGYAGHSQGAIFIDAVINQNYSDIFGWTAYNYKSAYWDKGSSRIQSTTAYTTHSDGGFLISLANALRMFYPEDCECVDTKPISIQKSSANTALTGGNSGYSLAGAVYGIYKTSADASANKNVLETITTNAGGTATTSGKYSPGTYYIKELTASKGYLLDSTVHTVTLSENGTLSGQTAFIETPADAPELIRIKKVSDGSLLTGAVFQVDFYPNDNWSGNPAWTWYYKSVDGVIDLLNESNLDSTRQNSAFYKNTAGANTFPLGTVRVTEVEAPEGYVKADFRLDGKITQPTSGGKAVFSWTSPAGSTISYEADGTAAVENEVIRGNLKILKQDGAESTPLEGAVYQVRDAEGKTVAEGTTDASGTVTFPGLPYGSYSYTEIHAPKGYVLDEEVYPFSITENGLTASQVRDNVRREGTLHVEKLNSGEPLAWAVFLLEYSTDGGATWQHVTPRGEGDSVPVGGCTSPALADGTLTTDESGKVSFTGLRADGSILYRLTEVKAPEGYTLLSEPLYTGTLPVALTSGDAEDCETYEGQHYGYTLYVKVSDGQVFRLPQTGGSGFSFIPLALMTLAIIYAFVVYYTSEKHNKIMLRSAAEHNKNQKSD